MTRFLSAIAAICLVSMPALAQNVSTDDVYACAGISTDGDRLACYDTTVGRLKAAEDAGEMTTITRSEVEQVKRDSFGFSIPSLPSLALRKSADGDKDLNEVTTAVSSVSRDGTGHWRVRLENGQVWLQTDDKGIHAKNVREARIYSASLGSFKMKLDGGLAFRVRREQ